MAVSADEEIGHAQEKKDEKMDDTAALLDYLIKFHLLTASATLKFLGQFGSSTNPQMKELKDLLVKSQRTFIEKHDICRKAGVLTEENTKDNVARPDLFKVDEADGN
jgi:hypothetical protein